MMIIVSDCFGPFLIGVCLGTTKQIVTFLAVTGSHIDRFRGSQVFQSKKEVFSSALIVFFTAVSEKSAFAFKKACANVFFYIFT